MNRSLLPLLCLLTLLCTCDRAQKTTGEAAPREEYQRPNILWLTCEDISPMLPMFGDSTAATPNLSRLAARGVRFPNTFSVAGVCAPSRNCITMGMYPISIGGHNMRTQYGVTGLQALGLPGAYGSLPPPEAKMMSQVLREHGYFTSNNQKEDYQFFAPKTGWSDKGPQAHWRHRQDPQQPFFSIFNMEITHESQVWTTRKSSLRFGPGFEEATANVADWKGNLEGAARPALTVAPDDVPLPPYLVDDQTTRTDVARVYSNIEIMDRQVGVLLDQLEEDGLMDNTIIFFYSDHGGPLPRQKRLLYDSGLRVPMIVAWPDGRRAGTIDSSLFSFVDLAPTVFSLAGIDVPEYCQGQALLGAQAAAAPREYVFAASDRLDGFYDRIRAARDDRYKYLRNYYPGRGYYLPVVYREQMNAMQSLLAGRDAGTLTDAQAQWFRKSKPTEELFDTKADPHELNNLAGNPAHADKLSELRGAMDDWLAEVGDLGAVNEVELVQQFWNGADVLPVTGRPQLRRDSTGRFILESKTPGAQIAYQLTRPGGKPGVWEVYTEPLTYTRGDTLRAVAHRIGYAESGESVGW